MEIDLEGAEKIYTSGFQANFFFIVPPSIDELRDRLINRGTESAEKIEQRVTIAKNELEAAFNKNFFSAKIKNEDLETAHKELVELIKNRYPSLIF